MKDRRTQRINRALDELKVLELDLAHQARILVRLHIERRDYSHTINRMMELTARCATIEAELDTQLDDFERELE